MADKFYVNSVEQCMSVILGLGDDLATFTNDEKRSLYLARTYYLQNEKLFSEDQKSDLFNKKPFLKNIPKDVANMILNNALLHETILPTMLGNWFNSKEMKPQLIKYLDLVIQNNHEEQLQNFCERGLELTFNHYKKNQSVLLSDILIAKRPEAIIYNKSWSDEKIIHWLEKNQPYLIKISTEAFNNDMLLSDKTRDVFFDLLAQQFISENKEIVLNLKRVPKEANDFFHKKNDIYLLSFFSQIPTDFLTSLEKQDKALFSHLMNIYSTEQPLEKGKPKYSLSFIQSIYSNRPKEEMLDSFRDLIFKPVQESHNFYKKFISFPEFLLEKDNYAALSTMKDRLGDNETKKAYIAAQLCILHNIYSMTSGKEMMMDNSYKALRCLEVIEPDFLDSHLKSVKTDLHPDVYSLVGKIVLTGKLHQEMPDNNNNQKRNKI